MTKLCKHSGKGKGTLKLLLELGRHVNKPRLDCLRTEVHVEQSQGVPADIPASSCVSERWNCQAEPQLHCQLGGLWAKRILVLSH